MKDISIIVPCKQLQDCIHNLLFSFHMLNLKNIEYEIIFIFDEGNTEDETINIIKKIMSDMNYQILFAPTEYAGMARNYGIENSNGEFIWFVDGDDWIIYPDVLQTCLKQVRASNEDIIQIEFVSNLFKMKHYSMVWQYIFRRSFLTKNHISFAPLNKYEDNDFMSRAFTALGKTDILYLGVPCYFYNYNRPGSVTYQINRGLL